MSISDKILFILLLSSYLVGLEKTNIDFATYLMREGEYNAAITEFKRCLFQDHKEKERIIYNIGLCHYFLMDYTSAIKYWKEFTEMFPQSDKIQQVKYSIGLAQLKAQKYQEAIDSFNQFYTEKTQYMKAISFLAKGDIKEGKKEMEEFLIIFSTSPLAKSAEKILLLTNDFLNKRSKSSTLSLLLSILLPGSGQIYCNRLGDGIFSFCLNLIFGSISVLSHNYGTTAEKIIYTSLFGIVYIGNIYGSYGAAKNYNNDQLFILQQKINTLIPYDLVDISL